MVTTAIFTTTLPEATSGAYKVQILDETNTPVPAASFSAVTLTLYDALTGNTINARAALNALNANDVTIDSNGNLVWAWRAADQPIVDEAQKIETHYAVFAFTWGTGKGYTHVIAFRVQNKWRRP